jgi:hypothetical protein
MEFFTVVWEFLKTPVGIMACVAAVLMILLVISIINLIRATVQAKQEEEEASLPQFDVVPEGENPFAVQAEEEHIELERVAPRAKQPNSADLETPAPEGRAQRVPAEVKADIRPVRRSSPLQTVPLAAYTPAASEDFKNPPLQEEKKTAPRFEANVALQGKDHFRVDGVEVNVRPDVLRLALEGDELHREIVITVAEEYTDVVIESAENDLHFAMVRDTAGKQKVVIQKKKKSDQEEAK